MALKSGAVHFNCPNCNALYQKSRRGAGNRQSRNNLPCLRCAVTGPRRDMRLQIFSFAEGPIVNPALVREVLIKTRQKGAIWDMPVWSIIDSVISAQRRSLDRPWWERFLIHHEDTH
jgi:predicted RNA-binding Zn-ribbon protein involved in translation (DUF1610 family)